MAFYSEPVYYARGTILIKGKKREKSPEAIEIDTAKVDLIYTVDTEDLSSEMSILSSSNVLKKAMKELTQEDGFPELKSSSPKTLKEMRAKIRSKVKENLEVKVLPSSTLIKAVLYYDNAQQAVTILEKIFKEYQDERFRIFNPRVVEKFYQKQVVKFQSASISLEDQLIKLAHQVAAPEPEVEIQNNLFIKKDIEQQLVLLNNRMIEKKIHIKALERDLRDKDFQTLLSVSSMKSTKEKIESLLFKKADLMNLYTPDSQKVQQIKRGIATASELLYNEVRSHLKNQKKEFEVIQAQMKMQEKKIHEITARNIVLHDYHIHRKRIEQELQFQKDSYLMFTQRWEEAKINNTSEANNLFTINIIENPSTSGEKVFPKKKKSILMGMVSGFITGCCFAFILAYFDHSVKTPDDIVNYSKLPVIYSLPPWKKL
jgi:uncharacterized protein involved in exopolysaccharide biosynthesis